MPLSQSRRVGARDGALTAGNLQPEACATRTTVGGVVQGVLADVEALEDIKMATRAAVTAFVDDRTDRNGRVSKNALANFARMGGLGKEPYMKAIEARRPAPSLPPFNGCCYFS